MSILIVSWAVIMMALAMTVEEPFANKESIQSDRFCHFALIFFAEEIFFDNIMARGTYGRAEISAKIGCLTVLTFGIHKILE